MNDMYTVRTFRENLREAFNRAEAGESVIIERYGKAYKLVSVPSAEESKARIQKAQNSMVNEWNNSPAKKNLDKLQEKYLRQLVDEPTYTDVEEAA